MTRFSKTLSLLALAAFAGCAAEKAATPQVPVVSSSGAAVVSGSGAPVTSMGPAVAHPAMLRAGYGMVESISIVNPPSASTGGPMAVSAPYRLTVRMDDSSVQWIDVTDRDYRVGDRLQITGDNRILKL